MCKSSKGLAHFVLIVAVLAVLIAGAVLFFYFPYLKILSRNIHLPIENSSSLPINYQECDSKMFREDDVPAGHAFPYCEYFVEETDSLYEQCLSSGGERVEEFCYLCQGCGCTSAGCRLFYVNPYFTLPSSYAECEKVSPHSGGRNIDENDGKEHCSILIRDSGLFNKEAGGQLLAECFDRGGETLGIFGGCELKFYVD